MERIDKIADIFKALGDPTRLRLIKLLKECHGGVCQGGPLCVNALAHRLGVTQSAVSQHLRILKQAGLVRGTRSGAFMHYTLDSTGLADYKAALRNTLGDELVIE